MLWWRLTCGIQLPSARSSATNAATAGARFPHAALVGVETVELAFPVRQAFFTGWLDELIEKRASR